METTTVNSVNETAPASEQNNNNCKNIEFTIDSIQNDDLINGNDNDEFDFDSSDLEDNSDTEANIANCEIQNVSATNAKDDIDCSNQIENEVHSIEPLMANDNNKSVVLSNGRQLDEEVQKPDQNDEQNVEEENEEEEEEPIFYYLEKSNEIAEARLAQRRLARAEAREIRMRELERQQKEQEQNADRAFDMQTAAGIDPTVRTRFAMSSATVGSLRSGTMSSRRSSEDSLEEEGRSLRDMKQEIKDFEERYRKAMIANAQLDNERASNTYQIQLLKDKVEEMEETHAQLQREYKDKCRDYETLKRTNEKLMEDLKLVQGQLNERDTLIAEEGLTIVTIENEEGTDAKRALVTNENAQLLDTHQGSLDVRLKKFTEEKAALRTEIDQLHQQLISAKTQRRSGSQNGPVDEDDFEDAQREANKLIADYKYKLTKAEQEIASLQASLARSETQVIRYKSTADAAEKVEAELKVERRKLQRENREMMERLEELETSHNHLLKRLDKLKNAKSTLLKEL